MTYKELSVHDMTVCWGQDVCMILAKEIHHSRKSVNKLYTAKVSSALADKFFRDKEIRSVPDLYQSEGLIWKLVSKTVNQSIASRSYCLLVLPINFSVQDRK